MVALSSYLSTTQSLIQSPQSPIPLVNSALLTQFVNLGRTQVALDAECVRGTASDTGIASGTLSMPISVLTVPSGAAQAIVLRAATLQGVKVDFRPFDWFQAYYLPVAPASTIPTPVIATIGQGERTIVYLSSPAGGTLEADAVLLPSPLAGDSDPDLIPYPWTEAVPFYAAWYAYMAMQRQADAQLFLQRYTEIARRGRTGTTSTNLPDNDPGGAGALAAAMKMTLGMPPPQMAPPRAGG
jgi:hypothetical protein